MTLEDSRVWIFVGLWLLLAVLESFASAGGRQSPRSLRWRRHLGLAGLYVLMLRIIAPGGAVVGAAWAAEHHAGLLQQVQWPAWAGWALSLLVLDLAIYWQHRIFHLRPLWWLHAVHHSDTEFDLSTGIRFHPFEILLSLIWKICVVVALGAPAEVVLLYEIILSSMALFTHADVRLPESVDRPLRRLIVTPNMHRIHHSTRQYETDSNYGNALSVWDRLFRSYRSQPDPGFQFGLERWRAPADQRLGRLLGQPFDDEPGTDRLDSD